jgi:hypothetical protein
MKKLIFIITIILLLTSCSEKNNSSLILKKENLEKQLIKIKAIDAKEDSISWVEIRLGKKSANEPIGKVRGHIMFQIDSIEGEIYRTKLQIGSGWYKGQNLPCEKILHGLEKQKINICDYEKMSTFAYDIILRIDFGRYNMEDLNKIKKIISKELSFEPEITDGDLLWTTSYGSIEVYKSGGGNLVFQFLSIKK